ncbi:tRNA (N6-threonylcarbamoyladenosine(37)-N6)-methyltransferase TrmO [Thiococcus pfennigii]|uniref:tRNA (N6-threonylcarbamoyladenosine(37)-N6)-methyltransferase TrmO n=1 Tax=Thiococcus pfennigii TaxID=1057 RepID=UPI001902D50B|nr:tRNA (N6-threonylcarbamoyladenosine(37)-N6)-methyltransferase TrmO [Thiococcus pfennigii]MBK1731914.1 tRNA (N6-threonylcarbamoyladenosine(37)-N6)-methyltransferase TrmO [Thiococcus pfennigii]
MDPIAFQPIGIVRSCFTDKFGIPRQANLVPAATGRLILQPPFDRDEALQGLDGFSHLWLIFVFHDCLGAGWRPTVRPPRLGGRRKVGVFASRAPYRPNPIGISAVEYLGAKRDGDGLALHLAGIDLLDGTPVLDIKPYVPYADALPAARAGFAPQPPESGWAVAFSDEARAQLAAADPDGARRLEALITQVILQDPRPGYMDRYPDRTDFAMRLYDLEIRWRLEGRTARVLAIDPTDRAPGT